MVVLLVAAVVLAAAALWAVPAVRGAAPAGTPRTLRALALVLAVLTAALSASAPWADSGGFAVVALGLPVLASLAAVLGSSSRLAAPLTWAAALVMLGWALLLGLGLGGVLLPPALVEALAAVTQHRRAPASALSGR